MYASVYVYRTLVHKSLDLVMHSKQSSDLHACVRGRVRLMRGSARPIILVDYDHVLTRACSAWPTGIRNRRRMRLGGAEVRVLSGSSGLCQRLCKNRTVINRFYNFTSLVLDTGVAQCIVLTLHVDFKSTAEVLWNTNFYYKRKRETSLATCLSAP